MEMAVRPGRHRCRTLNRGAAGDGRAADGLAVPLGSSIHTARQVRPPMAHRRADQHIVAALTAYGGEPAAVPPSVGAHGALRSHSCGRLASTCRRQRCQGSARATAGACHSANDRGAPDRSRSPVGCSSSSLYQLTGEFEVGSGSRRRRVRARPGWADCSGRRDTRLEVRTRVATAPRQRQPALRLRGDGEFRTLGCHCQQRRSWWRDDHGKRPAVGGAPRRRRPRSVRWGARPVD